MPKSVLIVEDSPDAGNALRLLIEFEGYQAVIAETAAAGRSMARAMGPDLILLDLALPDEDGLEVARELRSCSVTAGTPILVVSSHTHGIESAVLAAGCTEVFNKSEFIYSFRDTIKKYLAA